MDLYELVARNTQEIVREEELREILAKSKKTAYIGFAPTGRTHIGYCIPIFKITDFIRAGFEFTFLLADLHAYLDDEKTPWELLDARVEYYKQSVLGVLEGFGADTSKVHFVRGSNFEFERDYMVNVLRMVGDVTLNRSKRAASEVVRFKEDPKLGGFIYPILQIEDAASMGMDVALGGIDQRGIYMLGRELLEKFGRPKYTCVFTPLLPGLTGAKMSASDPASKIDLADPADVVARKLSKAHCPEGEVEGNGVLAFLKYVIFTHLTDQDKPFVIERPEKFGGTVEYRSYQQLEHDYVAKKLHPLDLKNALARELNSILEPCRKRLTPQLIARAYPAA
jgi:tyrosyl-tRNA synthetase